MANNHPKGWRPTFTYTGGELVGGVSGPLGPDGKFDDRPAQNPYPTKGPQLHHEFSSVPHISSVLRDYEKRVFTQVKLIENGDREVDIKGLLRDIRRFRALQEELRQNVYLLPPEFQDILDRFGDGG